MAKRSVQRVYPFETRLFSLGSVNFFRALVFRNIRAVSPLSFSAPPRHRRVFALLHSATFDSAPHFVSFEFSHRAISRRM